MASLLRAFEGRGLLAQVSDGQGLDAHLESAPRVVYAGFDPTASSLQVGNLVTLLMLRRFQLAGHRPIVLLGGATGLIGDPSGRSGERSLHDPSMVEGWVDSIRAQASRFVDFEGACAARLVNNLDWTAGMGALAFLRDVGKHFSVNAMMQRDSVRARLDREGAGISYTEFSYMLLQAYDFLELARRHDCTLQIGGSDQWGNIVSGVELGRRVLRRQIYALTHPLVTRQDGAKFGKSASGAVWLDAKRTSPYAFYQFWLNAADADAVPFLRFFTLLDATEIAAVEAVAKAHPQRREAQARLASEVTRLVHGDAALRSAQRISTALFGGDVLALSRADIEQLERDGIGSSPIATGAGLLEALVAAGLAASNGAARRLVQGGGVGINGALARDPALRMDAAAALHGRYFLLRRGRKHWHLLVLDGK